MLVRLAFWGADEYRRWHDPDLLQRQGVAQIGTGDLSGAIAFFERAAKNGAGPNADVHLAMLHHERGDRVRAAEALDRAIDGIRNAPSSSPRLSEVLALRAGWQGESGDLAAAERTLALAERELGRETGSRLQALWPDLLRARLLRAQGHADASLERLDGLIERGPAGAIAAVVLVERGQSWLTLGDTAMALRDFALAIEAATGQGGLSLTRLNETGFRQLGSVAAPLGDSQLFSAREVERALSVAVQERVRLLHQRGEDAQALAELNAVLRLVPNDVALRALRTRLRTADAP